MDGLTGLCYLLPLSLALATRKQDTSNISATPTVCCNNLHNRGGGGKRQSAGSKLTAHSLESLFLARNRGLWGRRRVRDFSPARVLLLFFI